MRSNSALLPSDLPMSKDEVMLRVRKPPPTEPLADYGTACSFASVLPSSSMELPVRSPYISVAASALLTGCVSTNAAVLDPTVKYQKICPDGVQIFTSAKRVIGDYREVALLHSKGESSWTSERGMASSQRKKAAELGANGIIIGDTKEPNAGTKIIGSLLGTGAERKGAALAIYVPGDSARVHRACGTGPSGQLAAAAPASKTIKSSPAALVSNQPHQDSPAAPGASPSPREIPTATTAEAPDSAALNAALTPAVDETALARNPTLQAAMTDARESGVATDFFEITPGVLRVSVAEGFEVMETRDYSLGLLLGAYRRHRPFDEPGILELWDGDQKVGEYTQAGIQLGAEYSSPR